MRTGVLRANPLVLLSVGVFSLLGSFFITDLTTAYVALAAYALAAARPAAGLAVPARLPGLLAVRRAHRRVLGLAAGQRRARTGPRAGPAAGRAGLAGLRRRRLPRPGPAERLPGPDAAAARPPRGRASVPRCSASRRSATPGPSSSAPVALAASGRPATRSTTARYAGGMSFALLVHAMRGATRSAVAMDARGFATADDRTWAEPATWTRLDVAGARARCHARRRARCRPPRRRLGCGLSTSA